MMMLMLSTFANALFYQHEANRVSDGIFDIGLLSFDRVNVSRSVWKNLDKLTDIFSNFFLYMFE